ncbi:HlyC/CorC family transporter [Marinicella gelatinilytica]|uniref:HlyC/CorC family transporter n=1 Tax=Marinicella gelatinilytica TaxID=2996017 RepID=UPI002260FA19|nr:CBS domain-containing protein [Marinicella gelatinilytica]MCX7544838.1 CBS domain-containing protein [Marinicella gelatinilytica]
MTDDQSNKDTDEDSSQRTWLSKLTNLFNDQPQSHDDILEILNIAHEDGLVDAYALSMMKGALSVSELQVRQVMVPRSQMVVVPIDATIEQVLPIIVESGHSRFPVVGEDKDELEGILLAKDVLRTFVKEEKDFNLKELTRPAVVIPESKPINILLQEFRTSRNHMALVIDEYGGVAGLVTIEDILEEIVGEIDDEYDSQNDPFILKLSDKKYRINALTTITEFNEYFELDIDDSEFDTVGGMVANKAGRLLDEGETIVIDHMIFTVTQSDKRRILFLDVEWA